MKQLEQMQGFGPNGPPSGVPALTDAQRYGTFISQDGGAASQFSKLAYDQEIKFLKDLIQEERQKREAQLEEHFKLYSGVQSIVHNLEGELFRKLKNQRED